jgi:sugar lactone lactonase YvrE
VGDRYNHCIRKITSAGVVTTIAGTGTAGYKDGAAAIAQFNHPAGVAVDSKGNIYVPEISGHHIRKIATDGTVSTFAGSGAADYADGTGTLAAFKVPTAIAIDRYDNLYVAESSNARVRRISPSGVVSTIAGNGIAGFSDGTGTAATLNAPFGIAIDAQGCLYVGEEGGHRVRKLQ